MYTTIGTQPRPADISSWVFDGAKRRVRCLLLTDNDERTRIEISMDRPVLDALQAALDEIRADMDAAAQTASLRLEGKPILSDGYGIRLAQTADEARACADAL